VPAVPAGPGGAGAMTPDDEGVAGAVAAVPTTPDPPVSTAGEVHSRYLLRVVQPALLGLMDGSISTLAPLFATAFATRVPHTAFLVGSAAAVGAGISMGFAEALSDTGEVTGRGNPVIRGAITGMATLLGGMMHALPFLIPRLGVALAVAYLVVGIELVAIAMIRNRYFGLGFWLSVLQVVVGGGLVFLAGILIGNS